MNSTLDALADGLAENGYSVTEHFLSQKEVTDILDLREFQAGSEYFKKAGIGKNQNHQINESIRGDYIHWIDKNSAPDPLRVYLDKLGHLVQFLNESLFLSLKDYEIHLTIYPAGTFYKRHLDQFNRDDHRKLSVICYLNADWTTDQGGQLRHVSSSMKKPSKYCPQQEDSSVFAAIRSNTKYCRQREHD